MPTVLIAYGVLLIGMRLKRYFGCLVLETFERGKAVCTNNGVKGILGLSLGRFCSFDVPRSFVSFEVPLDVLVITKQALIWMDSTFAWKELLKAWS